MIQREEFKEKAILVAMNALMVTYPAGTSPNYVAKKALEYAEAITLEVCGEEIVWPSDKIV
jgi:hypothetical protein